MRRKHYLKDALTKLAKPSFIPCRKLSVKFADDMGKSEGAVDLGGPTREFLRLSIREMFETSGMFGGDDKIKAVLPNSQGEKLNNMLLSNKKEIPGLEISNFWQYPSGIPGF